MTIAAIKHYYISAWVYYDLGGGGVVEKLQKQTTSQELW